MKILLLAGGFASRLWPLSEQHAKPLLLLNGRTILATVINQLRQKCALSDIVLLTNAKFATAFAEELKSSGLQDVEIFVEPAAEEKEKTGALRAVSDCLEHYKWNEDIAIIAGDNLIAESDLSWLQIKPDSASLLITKVDNAEDAKSFGVVQVKPLKNKNSFQVLNFQEKPIAPKSLWVSTGWMSVGKKWLFVIKDLSQKEPDNIGSLFTELLKQKCPIYAQSVTGSWFDVGNFDAYLAAHKAWQDPNIQVPAAAKKPQANNNFSGVVYIAPEVRITNSTIIDSIIYNQTKVDNCRITHCVIDKHCDLSGVDLSYKLVRHHTKCHDTKVS